MWKVQFNTRPFKQLSLCFPLDKSLKDNCLRGRHSGYQIRLEHLHLGGTDICDNKDKLSTREQISDCTRVYNLTYHLLSWPPPLEKKFVQMTLSTTSSSSKSTPSRPMTITITMVEWLSVEWLCGTAEIDFVVKMARCVIERRVIFCDTHANSWHILELKSLHL